MKRFALGSLAVAAFALAAASASAQNVKITPLGSHAGELCDRDRATIFEDPTGVRILYDVGGTVTGGDDARLGDIHVVLLSHAHGDHMGDRKMKALEAGTCDRPETISAAPNSTIAEVAAAKNSAIDMINPMANFVGKKVEAINKKPVVACPQTGPDIVVPLAAPCLAGVNLGGMRAFKTSAATRSVEITTVVAVHDSTVSRDLVTDPEKTNLANDGASLIGNAAGPSVVGALSDLLTPRFGEEAIRYSMLIISVTPVLAALCFWRAAALYAAATSDGREEVRVGIPA